MPAAPWSHRRRLCCSGCPSCCSAPQVGAGGRDGTGPTGREREGKERRERGEGGRRRLCGVEVRGLLPSRCPPPGLGCSAPPPVRVWGPRRVCGREGGLRPVSVGWVCVRVSAVCGSLSPVYFPVPATPVPCPPSARGAVPGRALAVGPRRGADLGFVRPQRGCRALSAASPSPPLPPPPCRAAHGAAGAAVPAVSRPERLPRRAGGGVRENRHGKGKRREKKKKNQPSALRV